jgi:hypothetical protein
MVRPAGADAEVEDEVEDEDAAGGLDVVELVVLGPVVLDVPDPAASPPEQAARDAARASPAAYERGARSVIFVTNPSLDSAF